MSSRGLLNLVLLVTAVVAGLFAYLHRPGDTPAQPDHPLVPVAPADIRSIELERVDSTTIQLRHDGNEWRMTLPVPARLDDTALARLLDVSRLRSSHRLPADELARYGLDRPWARLRFEQHVIEFGNTNAVTEELYVRSGERVHAVPARVATAIPGTPGRLIAHRMFAATEMPVAIALQGFRLRHDGTRWQAEPALPGMSQDDLIRWIEQWRHASSVITQPGPPSPSTDVTVELRDGRRFGIGIKARTPDLVLHRSDEGLDYHFNAGMAAMLLVAPTVGEAASASPEPGK
jgi:hypothetical protein